MAKKTKENEAGTNKEVDNVTEALQNPVPREDKETGEEKPQDQPQGEQSQASGDDEVEAPLSPAEMELHNRAMQRLQQSEPVPDRVSRKDLREEAAANREQLPLQAPSTKRFGELGKKVPGAERVKIHYRQSSGRRILVEEYDMRDLAQSQSVESFINRYCKPKHGGGEYTVTLVDPKGREFDAGVINISSDSVEQQAVSGGTSLLDVIQTMITQDQQRRDRELERMSSNKENPVKQLGEMFDLQEKVVTSQKKDSEGALGSLIQAMASQTRDMMQLMLQQQAKGEERMQRFMEVIAQPKGVDPILGAILADLLKSRGSSEGMGALPPPPPPANPISDLKGLAEVVALLKPEREQLGIKDILELVKENRREPGADDFKHAMENWAMMMQAVQSFRQHTEGSGGGALASLFDAVGSLFSNPELGKTVAEMIRAKQQANASSTQAVLIQQAQLARNRQLLLRQQAQQQQQQQSFPPPRLLDSATVTPPPVAVEPGPRAATEEEVVAAQRVQERLGRLPQLPPNLVEHVNAMVLAQDDAARVEAVINLLIYLAELEDWKQFSETMFGLIQQANPDKFSVFMRSFFEGLERLQLLTPEPKENILSALAGNFDILVQKVQEQSAEEKNEEVQEEGEEAVENSEMPA